MKTSRPPRALTAFFSVLTLIAAIQSSASAQETNPSSGAVTENNAKTRYNIEIENGQLLAAPLKARVNINALWGPGSIHSVPATIDNLAKYLRAADTNLNLVLSPEAANVTIQNLKLRSADMAELVQAVMYATGGTVRGSSFSNSRHNWMLTARPEHKNERMVEVFNLNGFIGHLGKSGDSAKAVDEQLNDIQQIILETLVRLKQGNLTKEENPDFRFHRGTGLFIVIGTPTAIDVTRKVVNALPGQPPPGPRQELLDLSPPPTAN